MKDFPLSACASGRTCSAPVGADMDDLFFKLQSSRNGNEWAWMLEKSVSLCFRRGGNVVVFSSWDPFSVPVGAVGQIFRG